MDVKLEWREDGYRFIINGKESQPVKRLNNINPEALLEVMEVEGEKEELRETKSEVTKILSERLCLNWLGEHPLLMEKSMSYLNKWLRRDLTLRELIFYTGLSAYTSEPLNLFLPGPSSIGKTFLTVKVIRLFPPKDTWLLGGMSPTSLAHEYGRLEEENGFKKYVVDMRGKILVFLEAPSYETFLKLRPILSHDVPEITYKFSERSKKGYLGTRTVYVRGWPATIFCTTARKWLEDLATRSLTASPEMSQVKYKAAIELKGKQVAYKWLYENPDSVLIDLRGGIYYVTNTMRQVEAVIPYGEDLARLYPNTISRDMRDFTKLTSLISQHTLCHLWNRPWVEGVSYEGKPLIVATLLDFERAFNVFKEIAVTTRYGLGGHIINFLEKVLVPVAKERSPTLDELGSVTYEDIVRGWQRMYGSTKSQHVIKSDYIAPLMQAGLVDEGDHPTDKRKRIVQVLTTPEEIFGTFKRQFYKLFTPEHLEKWVAAIKKSNERSKVRFRGERLDEEDFSFKYFTEWVPEQ